MNDRIKDLGVNVVHIESRKSLRRGSEFEILVDVECDSKKMEQLTRLLSREVAAINLAQYEQMGSIPHAPSLSAAPSFGEFSIIFGTFILFPIHMHLQIDICICRIFYDTLLTQYLKIYYNNS